MAATRAELAEHVGGNPSRVQARLIERAARPSLYIELMDARALTTGGMTERDSKRYLAWTNSFRLALRELGMKAAAPGRHGFKNISLPRPETRRRCDGSNTVHNPPSRASVAGCCAATA
jgi:hypothetical protein